VPIIVAVALAVVVGLIGRVGGLDRDRAFYPTALIVIASYYALFAVMGSSTDALVLECLAGAVFLAAAIVGFRSSLWVVAVAIASHGAFDFVHDRIITNPGMPAWWPLFCGSIDIALGAWLAWLLKRGSIPDRAGNPARLRDVNIT